MDNDEDLMPSPMQTSVIESTIQSIEHSMTLSSAVGKEKIMMTEILEHCSNNTNHRK